MEWAEKEYGTKEVVLTDDQRAAFIELVQAANLEKAKELDKRPAGNKDRRGVGKVVRGMGSF